MPISFRGVRVELIADEPKAGWGLGVNSCSIQTGETSTRLISLQAAGG
jgi:hypothetical protein